MSMNDSLTISIAVVADCAGKIEQLNEELTEELTNSQKVINNLQSIWRGEAADATIDAYNAFAKKHFENYHDVLDSYVKFLRKFVVAGYEETETANKKLAEMFN